LSRLRGSISSADVYREERERLAFITQTRQGYKNGMEYSLAKTTAEVIPTKPTAGAQEVQV
jgi:hypothetical protein